MGHRQTGRALAVGSCLLAFLGTACTPSDPPAPPAASSVPSAAPTPTENAQELEERLAYAAAEKSYRDFRAEFRRITGAGGASKATQKMKDASGGPYLADATKVIRAYKDTGSHTEGDTRIGYVIPAGYSDESLLLNVCEDETAVKTFDAKNRQVARNQVLILQLDVREIDGLWKVWNFSGHQEKSCG